MRTQTRMPVTVATVRSVRTAMRQQHLQDLQDVLLCPPVNSVISTLLFSWVCWLLTEPRLEVLSEEAV